MNMIAQNIVFYRIDRKMSLKELAEKLALPEEAVESWESGRELPTSEQTVALANALGISVLKLLGEEKEENGKTPMPDYEKQPTWECYMKDLGVEYRQTVEEGKDIEQYKALFDAVAAMPNNRYKDQAADVLYALLTDAPVKKDYPYHEPSTLSAIRQLRKPQKPCLRYPDEDVLADKVKGGWFGRICGCLLGKPVEGIMSNELETILRRTGNYPMTRYIDREEITEEVAKGLSYPIADCAYPRDFGRMPPDDDTNYMIIGYRLLSWYGKNFTAENVASTWLRTQIKNAYCTAERVAYRNFVNGYQPPMSAVYKNPYREWIGAQIRGDFFGYINPCDTEKAAEMAHRDASISHIKNGIYGEMLVSAMIAAAFGTDDIETVIRAGMAELPYCSRLYEALEKIIAEYKNGKTEKECFDGIHERWDEYNSHDWCHTVSNAEIVAASLLYGGGDYSRSVGMAVMTGFDTDCNGATVGSVLGVLLGYEKLPAAFTDRVRDTLDSNITGYTRVSISDMAKKTVEMIGK